MQELKRKAEKELDQIAQQGFTASNLDSAYKLIDIVKDIAEIEEKTSHKYEGGYMGDYRARDYRDGGYRDGYNDRNYNDRGYGREHNDRMTRSIERLREGVDMYQYGRERYNAGGSQAQMNEGLENMMYAICSLIESGMDIAQTAEEKEIIRKHIKKLQSL